MCALKRTIIFLALSLPLIHAADEVGFTPNGQTSIPGWTGTVYQAFSFVPVCGTLASSESKVFDLKEVCKPAIEAYRNIANPFALYDLTGAPLPSSQRIAAGVEVCMCLSLSTADKKSSGDVCVYVGPSGEQDSEYLPSGSSYGNRAAGSFRPNSQKSLPQCSEANLPALSSSVAAALGPNPTGSPGGSSGSNSIANGGGSGGSLPGGPAAIGIWLPILAAILIGGLAIYLRRRRTQRKLKMIQGPQIAYQHNFGPVFQQVYPAQGIDHGYKGYSEV